MLGYIISDKEEINVKNYEIQSFDILHKTNLNIFVIQNNKVLYKNDIIYSACYYGHVKVLEWFKNSGYEFKYDEWEISNASSCGRIHILEWFKNSGYEFKYNTNAIDYASDNGHIKVLEWFKNSDYEFKYGKSAINNASCHGHIQVLEWFKNSSYEFKYNKHAINNASINGQVQVLEWFKNYGYKFKYDKYAFCLFNIFRLEPDKLTKILKIFSYKINIKKVIEWTKSYKIIFMKTIKFKTNNKYLRGYQKN